MKKYLLITSAILLAGCSPTTAHISYGDIASAFRGNGYSRPPQASAQECAVHVAWKAAQQANSQLRRYQSELENAQNALAKNRAWQGGSCVHVETQALPPRPQTLSAEEIAFESVGSCMNTVMSRAPMTDVVQAFSSIRKEDYLKIGAAWTQRYKAGHRQACSDQQTSLWDDWFVRMCGGFGPEALAACMDQRVESCVAIIEKSCRAPVTDWEEKVAFLKQEPEVLFQQCQSNLERIAIAEREIPAASIAAQRTKEEHQHLASKKGAWFPLSLVTITCKGDTMKRFPLLPRLDPDQPSASPLGTSRWWPSKDAKEALRYNETDKDDNGSLVLGHIDGEIMAYGDDRHQTTFGGSRAGKGDSLVIPNLLTYKGSVICIDPKGENASVTAKWRAEALGQKVYVLDPFRVAKVDVGLRKSINPLEFLDLQDPEIVDDVSAVAEAIVVPGGGKDPHWDESAQAFITGVLLFILAKAGDDLDERRFALLRCYLTLGYPNEEGKYARETLLEEMQKVDCDFSDVIAAAAATLMETGENERGSILSTARRQTAFLDSISIQKCLEPGGLDLSEIKQNPKGVTIYLVLPEWRIAKHARWLRLIITTLIHALERTERGFNPETGEDFPPVLMILEEMAALGRMQAIEKAAGYIAGFGVKLWCILQDLSQLKTHYRDTWETFLANSGVITAHGTTDLTTTEYLSKRLGVTEVSRITAQRSQSTSDSEAPITNAQILKAFADRESFAGAFGPASRNNTKGSSLNHGEQLHKIDLMTPDEIGRYFAREKNTILTLIAGAFPIRLMRLSAHKDEFFKKRAAPNPFHRKPKKEG